MLRASIQTGGSTITVSGSRDLTNADNGATLVYSGSGAINLNEPAGLISAFGCTIIQQGTGLITMTQGVGVAADNAGATIGINTFLSVVQVSTDIYAHQNPVTNQARVLFQSGIPFILASTGSIGNNGALTLGTALVHTYSHGCYMYFPADAIALGVAAGWYYTVMSSTTAGLIKNNTYVSGQPTIPSSPTAFATTGPGAYAQTTATDIFGPTYTVSAGSLGVNGGLELDAQFAYTNSAGVKTVRMQLGGTNLIPTTTGTTSAALRANLMTTNEGRADRQVTSFGSPLAVSGTAPTFTTIDTTIDKDYRLGMQSGTATDNVIIERFTLKLLAVS